MAMCTRPKQDGRDPGGKWGLLPYSKLDVIPMAAWMHRKGLGNPRTEPTSHPRPFGQVQGPKCLFLVWLVWRGAPMGRPQIPTVLPGSGHPPAGFSPTRSEPQQMPLLFLPDCRGQKHKEVTTLATATHFYWGSSPRMPFPKGGAGQMAVRSLGRGHRTSGIAGGQGSAQGHPSPILGTQGATILLANHSDQTGNRKPRAKGGMSAVLSPLILASHALGFGCVWPEPTSPLPANSGSQGSPVTTKPWIYHQR